MVADRHRLAAYYNKHCRQASGGTNIDDLQPQKIGFSEFFVIWAATHIQE